MQGHAPSLNNSKSVCMLVSNDMLNDPRVRRHAETLGSQGFLVTVICPSSNRSPQDERTRSYEVKRARSFIADALNALDERRDKSAKNVSQERENKIRRAAINLIQILITQIILLGPARAQRAQIYCANDLDTLLSTILAAGLDRKVVYDSHELWPDMLLVPEPIKTIARTVEKLLVRHTDLVMTVNEFIAAELTSRYSLRNPPEVVYNCPNKPFVLPKRRMRQTKIALYQGRYSPDRGLENLVRAADHLLPDIRLVLRGFGVIEKKLTSLSGGRTNVQFERPVKPDEVVSAASEADVGIITYPATNLNNYLASPNKLFEYMNAGLTIVSSDIPFVRKIVLENDIGALFDPRDPSSIANALNRATREPMLRRQRANLASVVSKYSWKNESKKLLQVYANLQ